MGNEGGGGEKTEKATSKKRKDAREKGQVKKSADLVTAFSIIAMFAVLSASTGYMSEKLMIFSRGVFGGGMMSEGVFSISGILGVFSETIICFFLTMVPLLGAAMIIGVIFNVVQVGFLFSTKALGVKLSRINPLQGLKRLISMRAIVDLVKTVGKVVVIVIIVYGELTGNMDKYPQMMGTGINASLATILSIVTSCAYKIGLALVLWAVVDYAYQWWKYEKDLKMSKYEVKMEYKQQEGDPQIKGKIRQKQQQMAAMRMMQDVPKADVVITNPTHYAIALKYDEAQGGAPRVTAKGKDKLALKIKEIARENGREIVENRELARSLYLSCDVGEQIPVELYQAVAQILAGIYKRQRG